MQIGGLGAPHKPPRRYLDSSRFFLSAAGLGRLCRALWRGFFDDTRRMPLESQIYSVMGVLQVTQLFCFTTNSPIVILAHDSSSLT